MKATFAAGCFWHVEEIFGKTKGVTSTKVGYTGGKMPNPSYQDVCGDYTGHAEAVQVEYDPNIISYDVLLDIFWRNHNPTTLNRQGPDIGSQYRSAIFCHDDTQMEAARKSLQHASKSYEQSIVTEIRMAAPFYDAEEYHQKYFQKHR
ncbi:MAG: peptide-methionine (S)-S-oxide reductase MsrA [Cenarchaeum sp. SB0665_bin_23]|nr:peptide-methionine (S)-S-oxide reductase MsrA [Cenarchaeum sp. SB0665_bin_23]MXZ93467.1 peptide-methionine (S)-S-oxide reductase MsrA [Cenarchaeum sp. SB0666_bin_15]MYB46272.1 peptide-methionine (S)-S-oxide reductase MsrA [Cenarchaeum sp. SB0662_bin_33]MYC79169.1 peptide-methionine (S)-S-oxide reductase MsrA [Cenarchaeum sp. SB0661_bin_35]MYD59032.1 peptide-methionine (S)-S-oxide reductase MsrA [Cenarchaeum sp. SB0678_bin_8]MYG32622.1 peptide-methionine (S)-S-oxide reductase MsrA [Cenarchae